MNKCNAIAHPNYDERSLKDVTCLKMALPRLVSLDYVYKQLNIYLINSQR